MKSGSKPAQCKIRVTKITEIPEGSLEDGVEKKVDTQARRPIPTPFSIGSRRCKWSETPLPNEPAKGDADQ